MRKTIYIFFIFFIMLTLIQLAIPAAAQDDTTDLPIVLPSEEPAPTWNLSQVFNRTSKDVYIAFSTWRPARQASNTRPALPAGHRITAYYKLIPGQVHKFYALGKNAFYLRTYQSDKFIKPPTYYPIFKAPASNEAFVIVMQKEISDITGTNTVLYPNPFSDVEYPNQNGYVKFENGTSVNITNDWVDINTTIPSPIEDTPIEKPETTGTEKLPPTATTSSFQATITPSIDGAELNTTGTAPIQVDTSETLQFTIKVTKDDRAVRRKFIKFSATGTLAPLAFNPDSGYTDSNGIVQTSLKLGSKEGTFKIIVSEEAEFEGDPDIKVNELSFSVTEGPGAAAGSIVISGDNAVDPRGGSVDGRISLNFKVITPAGNPVIGAKVRVVRLSGPNVENLPINPRPITDSRGEVNNLILRLKDGTIGTLTIQAEVGQVEATKDIAVRHTFGSLAFTNSLSSAITSGGTDSIEVSTRSRNGTLMSGVSITFSESSSNLNLTRYSGQTSSGKLSTTVQTRASTSGYWSGSKRSQSDYKTTSSERITVTASHRASYSDTVTKTISASTKVLPWISERRTSAVHVRSRQDYWPGWYWTDWEYRSLTSSECSEVLDWWGYATVSVADDPFVDEENIKNEDESSIRKVGARRWAMRVRIKEHVAEPNEVWMRAVARCAVIDSTFGAPSLHQFQPHPETFHLSEIWQELSQVPSETALLANYPNPFNPETWIPYQLSEPSEVTLTIYSADGRLIRTLALGNQSAGVYQNKSRAAYWDGRNNVGERVASGLYFYTLTARDFSATRKMLIRK